MIIEGFLVGMLGNAAYDKIKKIIKDSIQIENEDLVSKIYKSIEISSSSFFDKYGEQFGEPNKSFLARQKNIEVIIHSAYYGDKTALINELSPEGFDGANDASQESINYFVEVLEEEMRKDFELDKIITEKAHIRDTYEMLRRLLETVDKDETGKSFFHDSSKPDNWRPEKGVKYKNKNPNGIETEYMVEDDKVFMEISYPDGKKAYYEGDFKGNLKYGKLPFPIEDYVVEISEELILEKNVFNLVGGFTREVYKLKWGKSAELVFNSDKKLKSINVEGGATIINRERKIVL